jgi:hypothetical protein
MLRARPWDAAAWAVALAAAAYVIGYPFFQTRYPPMTDLPFHAAEMSILRNYLDPRFHFREQFTLHPLEVPYMSMYVIGAALALVLPVTWAAKGMSLLMLALLPAGLAVLFHGMKKTPLWGLLGLGLIWTKLSHWGWLNFVGSLGLYALAIGCALLALDRPTLRRQALLACALFAVFFTHVYRLPFALLGVATSAVVMFPATRRVWPVIAPILVVGGTFALWWYHRPAALAGEIEPLSVHWERWEQPLQGIFAGYNGAAGEEELRIARHMTYAGGALFLACALGLLVFRSGPPQSGRELAWSAGVTLLPLLLCAGHLVAFLSLPMRIGEWWNVYPRELEAAAFIVLAAMPDMPKRGYLRLPAVIVIALVTVPMGFLVARQWRKFEQVTTDFRAIKRQLPPAPRLLYLVFDGSGTDKKDSPFVHLPAWIQAESGGWLSFHFAGWRMYPIRYRENSAFVPPPFERDWEWSPQRFQVLGRGAWFDVFLVRSLDDPSPYFARDTTIRPVARHGTWWLFERQAEEGGSGGS